MSENVAVTLKKRGKIGFLTLNTKMNTLNIETSKLFLELLDQADKDEKIAVIIIKTAGDKIFSAGWDLTMFQSGFDDIREEFFSTCGVISKKMYLCKKPLIAQIQGSAIGTGVTISCSCDFRFVANKKDIFFRLPEVDIPLFPTTGPTVSTFSVFGPIHTKDMLLTSRDVKLDELEKWGAFTKICEPETLEKDVIAFAKRLARKPKILLHTIKPTLNIMGMHRVVDWYNLENDMSDHFFEDWLGGGVKESTDEFLEKIWKKYT